MNQRTVTPGPALQILLALIGAASIAAAVAMLGSAVSSLRAAGASEHWSAVAGEVTAARVWQSMTRSQGTTRRGSSRVEETAIYHVAVAYVYALDGQRYAGQRYSLQAADFESTDLEQARTYYQQRQPGASIQVYVDPAHADRAVLDRYAPSQASFAIGWIALAPLALGLACWWQVFAWRRAPRHRAATA